MRKKILLIFVFVWFAFCTNVCAKTITCDYGDYKINFYSEKYGESDSGKWYDIYDKNGNEQREQIDKIKPMQESDCPKEISIDRKKYNLVVSSDSKKVSCGNITDIPKKIPELTSYAVTIVQIAIPVILVIMGSMDLFKGITAQKEDEIKKGQQIFVKRLIVAALIFFIVVVVKLLISVIDGSSNDNISDCIDCFISNECN